MYFNIRRLHFRPIHEHSVACQIRHGACVYFTLHPDVSCWYMLYTRDLVVNQASQMEQRPLLFSWLANTGMQISSRAGTFLQHTKHLALAFSFKTRVWQREAHHSKKLLLSMVDILWTIRDAMIRGRYCIATNAPVLIFRLGSINRASMDRLRAGDSFIMVYWDELLFIIIIWTPVIVWDYLQLILSSYTTNS